MEENNVSVSDTDNKDACDNQLNSNRSSKRMKIQSSPSEVGTSNSMNVDEQPESASTSNCSPTTPPSSQSHRTRSRNYRNRNYRNSHREDSSPNESENEEEVMQEESSTDSNLSFHEFSCSTPKHLSDTESEAEEPQVLKKDKPKHTWYVVPEVLKRQIGYSSRLHTAELFRNQCYGSLHCVQRLELMYKLTEHLGCVNSLNFYPDGTLLASGSDDLNIVIWDWKLGKCLFKYPTKHRSNVFQSKFMHIPGELHIASCSRDGQVRLARVSNEGAVRENRKLGTHKAACHKLAVLPDQPHIILSAGEDAVVYSHDIRKTKSDQIINVKENGRSIPLYSIHNHPLRTHEFCVGGQDTVRVYDQRKTVSTLFTYHPFKKNNPNHYEGFHVTSAVYNYNGQEILASYNDADIYLFDINSSPGEYIHKYEGHRNGATIKGVNFFGPKSEFIVSGSDCGNVFFWEKNTEAIVQCMLGDDSGVVNCLEPHPLLPFICTSGLDWDVKVWVPSCETEPTLEQLPQIVKKNKRSGSPLGLGAHAPVLWMLWQHLRRGSSVRRDLRTLYYGALDIPASSGSDEDDDNMNASWEDLEPDDSDDNDEDEDNGDTDSVDFTSDCTTS